MATYSFSLPKFSGSTLEPTIEPLAFLPPTIKTPNSNQSLAYKNEYTKYNEEAEDSEEETASVTSSSPATLNSCSLKRPNRPTFIEIPEACKTFTLKDHQPLSDWSSYEPQEGRACQSAGEFLWDESTQTVYKESHMPHPNPSKHIFWSA
ncbi:hypothetical protein BJ944DRAFT_267612 [Cunninghamella echinulata]|nr:hypothetical protein BJ944DRAFT_267612 [Cunninghamella echinulata]